MLQANQDPSRFMSQKSELVEAVEHGAAGWLRAKYGVGFAPKALPLRTKIDGITAAHMFDLVSVDNQIVAEVKNRMITTSGTVSSAKILDTYAACAMLEKVSAKSKLLVLTDFNFYKAFKRNSAGRISKQIRIIYFADEHA
jgi:hypothetical protein